MNIFSLRKKNIFGFTLVEIIVVIGIIGLLTAVVSSSFSTAKKKGRVTKRISDMKQVQAALEFYYAVYRSYPNTGGGGSWKGMCSTYAPSPYNANNTIPGLSPNFIPVVPTDPQTSDPDHCYLYTSNGTDYAFLDYNIAELNASQSQPNYTSYPELVDSVRGTGANGAWKVSSPGGASW